jgi:hypothetical protein
VDPVLRARRAESVQRWRSLIRSCAAGALVFPVLFFAVSLVPGIAAAEGIGGYVDLGYNKSASNSEDLLGNSSHTDTDSYIQRYNLSLSKRLSPYLKLYASGLLDKTDSTTTMSGTKTDSTLTRVQPLVDLTLRSPVYQAGVRYSRREETSSSSVSPATTNINDLYAGIFGLYPPARDLPTVEMRLERSHVYDSEHISQDVVRDFAGLTMNHTPTNNITLQYRPSYVVTTDRLSALETRSMSQIGRAEYSNSFFKNRVSFDTSYNVGYNELTTSVSGTGTLDTSLVPFAGLSSIDDTPFDGALVSNNALVDGNLTASAGINIGMPAIIGGDTRERNIGLDFSLAQDVNMLRVWVDRELPAAVTSSYSWDIYTSSDNLNWNFYATVSHAPFGQFDNRFEITFASVNTRYIKVVVKPLSTAVQGASGFPNIFVTEIQAFSSKAVEQVRGKKTSSNQVYNFDGKALLLESANLYYHLSYFLARLEPSGEQRWTLANMMTASHRFSRVFSGSARAGREDFSDPTDNGFAYVADTSLDAVPLKTLRHSLSYSGRFEETLSGRTNTNIVFLHNHAEVYQGVDLTAAAGITFKDKDTGEHAETTEYIAGAGLRPHRTLELSFNVDTSRAHSSGGGTQESSTWTRKTDETATYHPVDTLYLAAGLSTVATQDTTKRSQNYALNWAPFFGGALEFSFAYTEGLESEKNSRVRTYSPSLTWKITRTTYLAAAYQVNQGKSDEGRSELRTFSTNLRAYF